MEFKIEITDAMINDAVKASVEAVVTDLIDQTDVIWEIVERCIEPAIIEFINSDRCNIDESVTEVIKNHIEDGDWLSDDKISKIINKKIISSFTRN